MNNSKNRSVRQALLMFFIKFRHDLSNDAIGSLMCWAHKPRSTTLSIVIESVDSVLSVLTNTLVPEYLGFQSISREEALQHHTSFSKAFWGEKWVMLILDGTYWYTFKSGQWKLMRALYCMHMKRTLVKTMSIVLADGWVIEAYGPFLSDTKNTDSDILRACFTMFEEMVAWLQPYEKGKTNADGEGDGLLLDKGFYKATNSINGRRLRWGMPAFRGHKGDAGNKAIDPRIDQDLKEDADGACDDDDTHDTIVDETVWRIEGADLRPVAHLKRLVKRGLSVTASGSGTSSSNSSSSSSSSTSSISSGSRSTSSTTSKSSTGASTGSTSNTSSTSGATMPPTKMLVADLRKELHSHGLSTEVHEHRTRGHVFELFTCLLLRLAALLVR